MCFPANFQLIAALNPSPTGHYQGEMSRTSPAKVLRYLSRVSGPFLDRFDLSIEIPLLPLGTLSQQTHQGASKFAYELLKQETNKLIERVKLIVS